MLRKTVGGLSLVALLATGAAAQLPFQEGFTFTAANGYNAYFGEFTTANNIGLTGELLSSANNAHPFQVWCVDPMEYVSIGQTSNPWITSLTNNSNGFGNTLAEYQQTGPDHALSDLTVTHNAMTGAQALAAYTEAAWLANNMTNANQNDYENAMWTVMGYGLHNTSNSIQAAINAAIAGVANDPNFHADEWAVITSGTTEQEFIYHRETGHFLAVTPEPATMSMLAMGLVGMAGTSLRRRKRKTA